MRDANEGGLRPVEDIQPHEWAKRLRARVVTDTDKLWQLVPTWLKTHVKNNSLPPRFRAQLSVKVPQLATRFGDPRAGYHFPTCENAREYVREFLSSNNLRP